ncbi:MAG: helix-turn-helix transcriptional regulator [Clostridia bacterium]|nr:helix-turn-helix transcriptional regulator [Clostridia bacterium]
MNKFTIRLNETLKSLGMSQSELARKINMSVSIVNNYCRGRREPSLDALMLICKALDESADYLLGIVD